MSSTAESVTSLCEQARALTRTRDLAGALALYQQAVALDADSIPAHEGVASLAFHLKNYPLAAQHFKRLSGLQPRVPGPLVNLGAVLNRQGDHAEAIKVLRQALVRDRRSAEAYYNLGLAHRGANQLSMAVSAYKEAIRLAPEMAEAFSNLGNVLLDMNNHTQAALNFERALQIRPDFEKARQGLQRARQNEDTAKRAISPFGRLVNIEEIERRNAQATIRLRVLTPQERFEDRAAVHQFAKDAEQQAARLLEQLRDNLSTAILNLMRVVTERSDMREWGQEVQQVQEAARHFAELTRHLQNRINEGRAHERFVREEAAAS